MSIAAKLTGALLVALLANPVAAMAEQVPVHRTISESGSTSPALASNDTTDQQLPARLKKKKKKPQFQTRFFAE
jgi:hypothetical protein